MMTTRRQRSFRPLLGQIGRALRHLAKYIGRFGFDAFQVLFLPVLVTGATLATFYAGCIR
ncbi:hypothetical protein [Streptomyces sp. NPDC006012]|uniref:hypothetical protein n=1 Tax=Streptomyces sp. NPDC006012 TaxID=3364739 RepID=UPI0036987F8A